jgi:hypothetical protein
MRSHTPGQFWIVYVTELLHFHKRARKMRMENYSNAWRANCTEHHRFGKRDIDALQVCNAIVQ